MTPLSGLSFIVMAKVLSGAKYIYKLKITPLLVNHPDERRKKKTLQKSINQTLCDPCSRRVIH